MSNDLLSCPFCGGEELVFVSAMDYYASTSHDIAVFCNAEGPWGTGCGASSGFRTDRTKAKAAWNTRAKAQSAPAGYVMVPVEPTDTILNVLYGSGLELDDTILTAIWGLLLAAAPKAAPKG